MGMKGASGRRAVNNGSDSKSSKEQQRRRNSEEETSSEKSPVDNTRRQYIYDGPCIRGICGQEAACQVLPNNTHTCRCPHDSTPPTADLKCPTRKTVDDFQPHIIKNIIPPTEGRNNNGTSANITTARVPIAGSRSTLAESGADVKILVGIAGICILTVIIGTAICWWKRKSLGRCVDHKNSCSPSPLALKKSLLVAERYAPNPQYASTGTAVPLLRRETLRFINEIGEGCFGKVFKGELQREDSEHPEIVVAIKVLKESATREAEEDFLREVDIMSAFRHPNILSLLGVVLRESGMSPMMVFEFMPHGDLAEVLRGQWRRESLRDEAPPPLTQQDLLSIALQIAGGMKYLAAQRFVHRDLACRNCLVTHGPVVKIADFGMSRDVYTCDYYKIGGSRLLPVRWMSPESVMYGRFTLESDIWSYGVVLWEIFSYGKQPYYGHTNEEVVKLILQGIMLQAPDECPTLICELMRSCWKTEPRDRIRFNEIHEKLQKTYDQGGLSPTVGTSGVVEYGTPTNTTASTVITIKNEKDTKLSKALPRPPPLPKSPMVGDLLDTDGYLLPQELKPTPFYLEALPD